MTRTVLFKKQNFKYPHAVDALLISILKVQKTLLLIKFLGISIILDIMKENMFSKTEST